MDDHVHRLVRQAEQEMRLDHLERFVHETGGVNGDLLSHFPGRVAQRFVHRSTRHALRVPGAERAARRRQNEPRQLPGTSPGDALQHGTVLGVDRHDLPAALARRPRDQLARHHQRLLVGERHPLPGSERGQRGLEPRRAHDSVQDDLDVRPSRRLDETFGTTTHPASRIPHPAIHDPDVRWRPVGGLSLKKVGVRMRGQGRHPKPLPLARQDLERRTADRSGGPENRDADGHARPNHRNSAAATGATKYTESRRSSTPPCPGIRDEESFTPTSRLNSDSATSPTCAATATTNPTVTSCQTPSRKATRSSTSGPYTSAATRPPATPPTAPAHVFRGESTGASCRPPTSAPAAIAHVSHTQVMTSGMRARATEPRGCASA